MRYINKVGIFRAPVSVLIECGDKILITKLSPHIDHAPNERETGVTGRVDQGDIYEQAAMGKYMRNWDYKLD